MPRRKELSRYERAHIEHFVQTTEEERSHPCEEADVERILADMQSDDERTRARAVREICPCRVPWETFQRLRKEAKRLQHDPSPLVAANALHIETDARRVAAFEAKWEQIKEREEDDAPTDTEKRRKHNKRRAAHG